MGFAEKGFWRFSYQKLAPSATAAGVMDVDETEEAQVSQARRPRSFCRIPDRWLVVGLVLSNLVLLLALAIHATRRPPCHDDAQRRLMAEWYTNSGINDDLKRTSAYSPILDWFDMKPGMRTLNGALRDNASIWRQPPSPEVDRAWDDISTEGFEVITVPESAVVRSGKDPAVSLRAPRSWGAGEDAYVAQIDVFHQIHCLNELRKEMDYDYYYQSSSRPPDELHRAHKRHCVHMLLQALMCRADVGIVTHNWVRNEHIAEPKTRPMPDFNVVKKCADFDGLLAWARRHAVPDLRRKFLDLRYEPGMQVVPGDGYA